MINNRLVFLHEHLPSNSSNNMDKITHCTLGQNLHVTNACTKPEILPQPNQQHKTEQNNLVGVVL